MAKQFGKQGAAKQGPGALSTLAGSRKRNIYEVENKVRRGAAKVRKGINMAGKAIKANPGKAGLAMAGLAAAGGLGIAGAKAIGNARKPKSLTDRLKNASKKMFK